MNVARYGVGLVIVSLALIPVAVGARRVRTRLLPDADGAIGLLADVILAIATILAICQLLGAVGLFRVWAVVTGSVVVGFGLTVWAGRLRPVAGTDAAEVAPDVEPLHDRRIRAVTIVIVAITVVVWLRRAARGSGGILDFDSLNYHLPFAARFLQRGNTLGFHYVTPGSETPFDPANSELLVAYFMLPFHRDILMPLLNIGWMAIAFVSAWCIGRPRGIADLTLAAGSLVIASPLMVEHDAGSASNDIVMLALFLATFAFLAHARGRVEWIGMAAVAAGVGLGTKLTLVVPVVLLTVAVIAAAGRGRRLRTSIAWFVPLIVTGSYWYLRNLVKIGNPVPSLALGIGALRLPSPHLSVIDRQGFTITRYLGDAEVWHKYFVWGLRHDFGQLWMLVLGVAVVGMIVAVVRGDRMTRIIGVVASVSFVAYVVTPTSAGGPKGLPHLFTPNVRFAFPAIALGAIGVAFVCARTARPALIRGCFVVLVVAFAGEHGWAGIPIVLVLAAAAAALASKPRVVLPRIGRTVAVFGIAVIAVAAVTVGDALQKHYLDHRFASALDPKSFGADATELNALYDWSRHVSHSRIAVVGAEAVYPLYGVDLTNEVQYIGKYGPHGEFERSTSCAQWRRQINDGHYDYIVTTHDTSFGVEPRAVQWARGPEAEVVLKRGFMQVLKLRAPLDPSRCPSES